MCLIVSETSSTSSRLNCSALEILELKENPEREGSLEHREALELEDRKEIQEM